MKQFCIVVILAFLFLLLMSFMLNIPIDELLWSVYYFAEGIALALYDTVLNLYFQIKSSF
ncbi:MAG: hypothetical protein AB7V50_03780 [Vampirovibrionia bacterium]